MALSNIIREPRREIIETLQGAIVPIAYGWLTWKLYTYIRDPWNWLTGEKDKNGIPIYDAGPFNLDSPTFHWGILIVALIVAAVISLVVGGALLLTHHIGEEICDRWAEIGMDPRPKERRR